MDPKAGLKILYTLSLSLLFLISKPAHSQEPANDHKSILSSLNLGFRYSSLFETRGVLFYRDFQIDPVIGIFLFDNKLEFVGDSLGYRDFIYQDMVRLRTRVLSISDKPLFPSYDSQIASPTPRPSTYEWSNDVELFLPGYNNNYISEIDLIYNKDISIHHGNYLELQGKIKICEFKIFSQQLHVEPNLYASMGWGDSSHNQYFYGPSANTPGINNISYGMWLAFPERADRFYPVVQLKRFEVLGNNRDAEYAVNRNQGWLFSIIATMNVLPH